MAKQNMRALRTYEGTEGMIRRGDVFAVENADRVEQLERLELAEKTDQKEVTNFSQRNAEVQDMKKEELLKVAKAENVTVHEDMRKEEIQSAILRKRENDYIQEQANQSTGSFTAFGNAGDAGTDTAAGTTGAGGAGAGDTGNTGQAGGGTNTGQ